MLGLGKVMCVCCGQRARRREARRAQDATRACVCGACFAEWDQRGRQCVACGAIVRGTQTVGLFADRRGLGHADCGGARVLRA
jgi:hypothetical protein